MVQAYCNLLFNLLMVISEGLSKLVETQQVVTVTLGGDAHFSCSLMEPKDFLQVIWQKETPGGTENMASYNERFGEKVNEPFQKKVAFLNMGLQICSIIIRGVSREDETCYKCLFNIYPDGSISGRTCLQIDELYGPTLLLTQTNGTRPLFSGFNLSCSATGRPAPIVDMCLPMRLVLENSTTINVTHPNGTVTVNITYIVAVPSLLDNITMFRCLASSGYVIRECSMKIPTSLDGLTPHPASNDVWTRGHVIGLLVLIALICIGVWCLSKRSLKCREERTRQENFEIIETLTRTPVNHLGEDNDTFSSPSGALLGNAESCNDDSPVKKNN